MAAWTDQLAGARMQVDQQFAERVRNSQFSNQEWGLIMTAVEWEIRNVEDPEAAELVADTSNVADIIPELDKIQQQMGGGGNPMGGGGEDSGGLGDRVRQFFDTLTGNGSGSSDTERQNAAEALVQEYARELQAFLEKRERWEDIRQTAAEERA
jgi:hypothetical protein